MSNIESFEAWYLGHASPEELQRLVEERDDDYAWEVHHRTDIIDSSVLRSAGLHEYEVFTRIKSSVFKDLPVSEVTQLGPNGLTPIPEEYVEQYLDN